MRNKIILISCVIIIELITVFLLGTKIYNKQNSRQLAAVVPLLKENLLFNATDTTLKHFYELQPNQPEEMGYLPPWAPYTPNITINSDTLNERFYYSLEKPDGVYRIITLGDSWTYGRFVHTANNYPERLEDLLNQTTCENVKKFEVINLGVPGYDLQYAVERYRVRGKKYDPDLVLWLVINNDFEEITDFILDRSAKYLKEFENQPLNTYDHNRGLNGLFVGNADTASALSWINARDDLLKEMGNDGRPKRMGRGAFTNELLKEMGKEKLLEFQKKILRSISDYYQGELVMIALSNISLGEPKYLKALAEFSTERPSTHLLESPISWGKDDVLVDGHPSDLGHERIAHEIIDYLESRRLIPCT